MRIYPFHTSFLFTTHFISVSCFKTSQIVRADFTKILIVTCHTNNSLKFNQALLGWCISHHSVDQTYSLHWVNKCADTGKIDEYINKCGLNCEKGWNLTFGSQDKRFLPFDSLSNSCRTNQVYNVVLCFYTFHYWAQCPFLHSFISILTSFHFYLKVLCDLIFSSIQW